MKVFIKVSTSNKPPTVLATYDDDADIAPDAHGRGAQMIHAPASLILSKMEEDGITPTMTLPADWRDKIADYKSNAPVSVLRELLGYILKDGTDVAKWPADAKKRHDEIVKRWPQP